MTTSIPARLRAIRAFLEGDVLPGITADLCSDLRASVKMLETMEAEVDRLPAFLAAETEDMIRLCGEAIGVLGDEAPARDERQAFAALIHPPKQCDATLGGMEHRHREASVLLGKLLGRLCVRVAEESDGRSAAHELYARCCTCLQTQASARIEWQAVFPVEGLYHEDNGENNRSGGPA